MSYPYSSSLLLCGDTEIYRSVAFGFSENRTVFLDCHIKITGNPTHPPNRFLTAEDAEIGFHTTPGFFNARSQRRKDAMMLFETTDMPVRSINETPVYNTIHFG